MARDDDEETIKTSSNLPLPLRAQIDRMRGQVSLAQMNDVIIELLEEGLANKQKVLARVKERVRARRAAKKPTP